MTSTKPDYRTMTQLGADTYQSLANLTASLPSDEMTDGLRAGLQNLAETVASVTEHLGKSGAGLAPAGGVIPTAAPANVREAAINAAVDLSRLAVGLQEQGLHFNPDLVVGMELLGQLDGELASVRPDVAFNEPVPFQVPIPQLDTRPTEGARPGEPRTTLDEAGGKLQEFLRDQNGRREELRASPVGEVVYAMQEATSDRYDPTAGAHATAEERRRREEAQAAAVSQMAGALEGKIDKRDQEWVPLKFRGTYQPKEKEIYRMATPAAALVRGTT